MSNSNFPKWLKAKSTFPKTDFPWEVYTNSNLSECYKCLGRSHSTSPTSIPGIGHNIISSILGNTIVIQPKLSWEEGLIFWNADIRYSGSGKTASARSLSRIIYELQRSEIKDYQMRLAVEMAKKKKDRNPVRKPRCFHITNFTMEGLLDHVTGNGGLLYIPGEISSFINMQNQYRKGVDREQFISLWDGDDIYLVRKGVSNLITGARLNIFGGIQPDVWKKVFRSKQGLYLQDGTIFRFLITIEDQEFFPLTEEEWTDEYRNVWENTLYNTVEWVNGLGEQKFDLRFNKDAYKYLMNWRNELFRTRESLPKELYGIFPKAISYAIRHTGIIYCINQFSNGLNLKHELGLEEVKLGIKCTEFYIGHIIEAIHLLCDDRAEIGFKIDNETKNFALILKKLESKVLKNLLPIGFIADFYNKEFNENVSAKWISSMIKKCELTKSNKRYNTHGKRGAYCLIWNEKTISFLEKIN